MVVAIVMIVTIVMIGAIGYVVEQVCWIGRGKFLPFAVIF